MHHPAFLERIMCAMPGIISACAGRTAADVPRVSAAPTAGCGRFGGPLAAARRSVDPVSRTRRTAPAAPPGTEWVRAWTQLAEIAWSAPLVIGHRTARMMLGGWPPTARDRREYTRMWQEKVDAFGQAYLAAWASPARSTPRAFGRAVRPVHRRVVSNRRRLARY